MKFRIFFIAVFLLIASFFIGNFSYAQTEPTAIPTGTGESDLGKPYSSECVAVEGVTKGDLPTAVADVKFVGHCSSADFCYVAVCTQLCDKSEEAVGKKGNPIKHCTAKSEHCTMYNEGDQGQYKMEDGSEDSFPKIEVSGADPHKFPPGDFNVDGKIIAAKGHIPYAIYAVSQILEVEQMLGQGDTAGNTNNEENPSQQLGTTKFTFPTGEQALPSDIKQKCRSVFWDPYGRVFDAISLEPLSEDEATVNLYHENGSYVDVPTNGSSIDNLGKYNIFIKEDGRYTLNIDAMLLHDFVPVEPDSRYSKLYQNIYIAGDPAFEEKQKNPKRIDLPVKPKSTPYQRVVEWVFKNQNVVTINKEEFTKIEFRVSHPLTKIKTNISGGAKCEQTQSDHTDNEGFCLLIINHSSIPGDGIKIDLIKNPDYYLYGKKSESQQSIRLDDVENKDSMLFDPILRHIEGYAFDEKGNNIPGAKIEIKLTNGKVFYRTTADDAGFFTIYKNSLPPREYLIVITEPATLKKITQTTSEFVKSNQSYLDSEKLNLMVGTKSEQPIVNAQTGKLNNIIKGSNTLPNKLPKGSKNPFNPAILMIVFVISLLVILVIGLILYIRKSKSY